MIRFATLTHAQDAFCANLVENLYDIYLNRDEYDVRELMPDAFPYEFYVSYLNTPTVQAAIGAYQNYSESNNAVYYAFTATGDDDREGGTIEALRRLLQLDVNVVLYAGDADYNCNWLGGEAVADEVAVQNWDCAGYVNISTSDHVVHGQVKTAGKFSFVRIYDSGHEVPFYQGLTALEMFERGIGGKDIATGKKTLTKGYFTEGSKKSEFREGNSTIQFEVLPTNSTYPPPDSSKFKREEGGLNSGMLSHVGKRFKPSARGRR
jgi:carboxypeptidase C (cathepsin A)